MTSGLSIEELEKLCEKLQRKVTRYETRLSDIVNAYKQLADEKHVLEDTVKALSSKNDTRKEESQLKNFLFKSKELVTKSKSTLSEVPQNNDVTVEEQNGGEDANEDFEKKFEALSIAYQSLTENKTKMENAFQTDKKALLNEYNKTVASLREEKCKLQEKFEETRVKLLMEQQGRSEDQKQHSSIMKELQHVVTEERLQKDELHIQLHESRISLENQKNQAECQQDEDSEMSRVHGSVSNSNSDDVGLDVDVEVERMRKVLMEEQQKAKQIEEFFTERQQQQENRIFQLENKVSELSNTVGEYESIRHEDQLVVSKLRHKVESVDAEKAALLVSMQQQQNHNGSIVATSPSCPLSPEIVTRKQSRLSSTTSSEFAFNNNETVLTYDENLDDVHFKCSLEYSNLKKELDALKLKYQRRQQEFEQKKSKVEVLRAEKERLTEEYRAKEIDFAASMSKLQLENTNISDKYECEIETLRAAHTKQLHSLQLELQKQRNRSMNLISEKDFEIEKLQKVMYDQDGLFTESVHRKNLLPLSKGDRNHPVIPADTMPPADDVVKEILSSPVKSTDGSLLHFIEHASHENELSILREKVLDMQRMNRDYECREEHILGQMQLLKEEIRRLERNRSRESANLEYLKNICYRYMMTTSSSVRKQMGVAISSILQFSKNEMKELEGHHNTSGWW